MITLETLEAIDPVHRLEIETALGTLSRFGLWPVVEAQLVYQLTQSFHITDAAELLDRIRLTQTQIKTAREFNELGFKLYKEKNNA